MKNLLASIACLFAAVVPLSAQITLSGTSYTQNFNTISNGLPAGWTVRTGASASSLGTAASFSGSGIGWGDSGGAFKNFASTVGNGGTALTGSETTANQGSVTNRSLGIRQVAAFGDPGAAFVLQIGNTLGYDNFELSLDFNMLSVQGRSTTWKLEYATGSSPTSFTQVGTDYVDPGVFGKTTKTFSFGSAFANLNENVWIRVVALTAAPGSGSRDSFGIDNFQMTFSPYVPPSGPPVISGHPQGATVWQGTNLTLTVTATGLEPLSYQWYRDNNPVANGTASALVLSNISTNQAGTYYVEVTNDEGADTSDPVVVNVQAPVVTTIANLRSLVDTGTWLPPESDTLYQIEGFVSTRVNLAATGSAFFYLQDATGGIAAFVSNAPFWPLYQDRVRLVGRLSHFNGLLQLTLDHTNPTHKYTVFGPSVPLPSPVHLQIATQNDIPAIEALEGTQVVISNVLIDLTTSTFISGTTIKITNAFNLSETFDLRIDSRATQLHGQQKPQGSTTIIGVLSQFSTNSVKTNGYQLLPTSYHESIYPGPKINTHPQSQNVIAGDPATLSVSAINLGLGFMQYQWLKNGVPISGATASSYTINPTAVSDTGRYSVIVNNDYAANLSNEGYLGVGTGSLSVMTYNVKGNFAVDFSAVGSQVQAIGRQLAYLQPDVVTLNEIPVGKTHVVTNLVNDFLPGYFWATNSGSDGSIRSVILSRWRVIRSESWLNGVPLAAFGHSGNFTRDLFEAEIDVPGYLQPLHVFTTHLKSGSGADECLKRAAEAGAISNYFVNGFLTTNSGRPYLLTGDLNEDINRPPGNGQQAVQRIRNAATGLQLTTPLNPFDQNDRTFSIQSLPLAHRYDYILPGSSLSSQVATSQVFRTSLLAPLPPAVNADDDSTASDHLPVYVQFNNPSYVAPIFLAQPQNQVAANGSPVLFTVEVASATSVGYQWLKDGQELSNDANLSGVTTASLNIGSATELNAGLYSVVASNIYGVVTSEVASLTIAVAPAITSEPVGSTNVVGEMVTFTVTASGTEPLYYQWKKNAAPLNDGGKISGALSAILVITNLAVEDTGAYSVTVTNVAGAVESSVAELAVFSVPTITTHPASRTVVESSNVTLTVSATGTGPLSYQWHFNSGEISGATTSALAIENAVSGNAGNYFVVVSNHAGSVTSSVALVKVALAHAPMLPSNLVVLRLGDSVQSMANTGNSAYLDQFTTTGDYVSTLGVPDSGANALIFAGGATSEGALSRSANGMYLTFAGYNTNRPASGSISGMSSAVLPRAVGQVAASGQFSIPVKTMTFYSGNTVRSAVTDGANNYWGAGGNNGTIYFGNESAPATVQGSIGNTRVVNVFNGNLYFSTGSGTRGIYRIEGTPASTSSSVLAISTGGSSSPYGFTMNASETIAYIADDSGGADAGIQRWNKVDGVWTRAYVLNIGASSGARGVVVDFSGEQPIIYATTAETTANRLIRIVDAGAGSAPVTLANAGVSQVFRGVQFGPDIPVAPQITSGPAGLSLLQGETASFNVIATGTGPLRYQWTKNGSPIPGETSSSFEIAAVHPDDAGLYAVSVSNMVTEVMSDSVELTVAGDPLAPVLKVLNPKANSILHSDLLQISGTAQDLVRVTSVEYGLNGAGLSAAEVQFVALGKASNWNAWVNLRPGTNELTVVATDLAGNETSVGPLRFYYHTASPLLIQTNLNGELVTTNGVGAVLNAISSSLYSGNNTNLFVGRTYTLKAVETGAPKYILTNWTATWEGQAQPVVLQTNSLTCTFEMKSNMVLKANFIDNPFYRFGGSYVGLFSSTNGVAFNNSGFAQIKVTPKLSFSAKLLVDGNAVAVSGKLSIDGTGHAISKARFKATGKPELTLNLALDFAGGTETLSGVVSESSSWTSELLAHRIVWSKTNSLEQAQDFTNRYTMLMPGFTNDAQTAFGTASGAIKVDLVGKVVLSGVGVDMHPIKQATFLSKEGYWPMFSPMYKVKRLNGPEKLITETRGFALGWIQFTNSDGGLNLRPEGQVHTIKTAWENTLFTPGWTNAVYVEGFTNVVDVQGSRWAYDPLAPQDTLPGIDRVAVELFGGDLGTGLDNIWDVTPKGTFTSIKTNTYEQSLKAALTPKTGVFKGTFIHPSNNAVTKYQGVMLQETLHGEGAFIGPTLSGGVTVNPVLE